MERNEGGNRTKAEIIENLAKQQVVEDIILNIVGEIGADEQDLIQDIYLDLLNKDEEKITSMNDKELRYFIARMAVNNIASKTSPYYYKYKKNTRYTTLEEIQDKV